MTVRKILVSIILALANSQPARSETVLACTFPTLPSVVMYFPDTPERKKTMEVGARPPVELSEGQGTGRFISAIVDGYSFRFSPENAMMDVEAEGKKVVSEVGKCATIGGPVNESPLKIEAAESTPDASPPIQEEPTKNSGKWVISEDNSAFDDSRTVVLSIHSDNDVRGQFGSAGPATVYLRCMENKTVVYLVLNDLFLSDIQGFGKVEYRIDDGKAGSVRMLASTDNKALGLWDGGSSIPFIKKLMQGKYIVFRATPFNESSVEFTVNLAGLDAAVTPLRKACSW